MVTPTAQEGRDAITLLHEIKRRVDVGKITYEQGKDFAESPLKTFNKYSARLAKVHGVSAKKITFAGFMR